MICGTRQDLKIMHSHQSILRFMNSSSRRQNSKRESMRHINFALASISEEAVKMPFKERYAAAMGLALKQEPVMLFEEERLVGMLIQTGDIPELSPLPDGALSLYDYMRHNEKIIAGMSVPEKHKIIGAPGHITWNWGKVIECGIIGLLQEIDRYLKDATESDAKEYYRSVISAWKSVLDWNCAHLSALWLKRSKALPDDIPRLDELIRIVSKVPFYPAETFHEALQSFYFQHLAVMFENPFGGNGPGRLDQILGPILERDLKNKIITREQAKYLVKELFVRFEERLATNDGWVESIMTGGTNPDGKSTINELSYIIIEVFMELNQTHPAIYPRITTGDPEKYWDVCSEYMLKGRNRCQIFNDKVCIDMISTSGVPFHDACNYTAGGCMEICIQGQCCDLNCATSYNVSKTFEEFILDPETERCSDFQSLYSAFEQKLQDEFRILTQIIDITGKYFENYRPTPLLSSLMDDCLKLGMDQHEGGSRYYDYGFAVLGVTSVADSLMAVKYSVYEQKIISLAGLKKAIKNNYAGDEALRQRLLRIPKYGEGNNKADALCQSVISSICAMASKYKNRNGGELKPMIFNFLWTCDASRELLARPDGALAGSYIGHGVTPQPLALRHDLTTALNSCLTLNLSMVSGGATTMWDFDDQHMTLEQIKAVIKVFIEHGGMIIQGNTSRLKEMELALDEPEKYPDLIVRVGGFSSRFKSLSREVRQEIVNRYKHSLQ